MRQAPYYLIIGDGRVARHFQHYFDQLALSFSLWHRRHSLEQLYNQLKISTHVLILIHDSAIESFIQQHLKNSDQYCIHFSGSLVSPLAHGAHPLMTFHHSLYTLEQYKNITFVIDNDAPSFETLLPGLPNPHARLDKSLKSKYHALCVMAGNFSCILWDTLFNIFENEFGMPASIAHPYLIQQTNNILENSRNALTGPLTRNDTVTIQKNIKALNDESLQLIYESFVKLYRKSHEDIAYEHS